MDGGYPPPFTENSAKIINLIFEPFPYRTLEFHCFSVPHVLVFPTDWSFGSCSDSRPEEQLKSVILFKKANYDKVI